jgi:phosphatidylinositol-bisphosphatase
MNSEKRRAPSWTDRILWKIDRKDASKQSLTLLSYSDCMKMMMSDHKPVRALLELNVRKIDSRLQKETREKLVQQLKDNQDDQPRGEISSSYVDFKKVQFMEYKEQNIILENTGQVLTVFKFLPKDDSGVILPPWLQVSPLSGVVAPGEKVVIRFEVTIDPTISAPLNRGEQKIDEILILRLENSKDFFISVSGDYIPTCFGLPLEELSEMAVPISEAAARNMQRSKPATPSNSSNPSPPPSSVLNQIDLPKELWKVMNFLWNVNMFQIVCNPNVYTPSLQNDLMKTYNRNLCSWIMVI